MESRSANNLPLVVIVGPTASGKTTLAIEIAKKHSGEIICADSRTVYKGMNIGTAKPTQEEMDGVPHWGLDLVEPNEKFSAADFKEYAFAKITEIRSRNHIPILVGGTGLYVDAVIFDYQFGPPADQQARKRFESWDVIKLQKYCANNNIKLPENLRNKRHLIRAIEQKSINSRRKYEPLENAIIVGIATERDELRRRIRLRAEQLFKDGVVEEATNLGKKYGWDCEAMTGNIYPLVHLFDQGKLSFEEMKERFITLDWRLAKRQLTWLKRNTFITWLPLKKASDYLNNVLAANPNA